MFVFAVAAVLRQRRVERLTLLMRGKHTNQYRFHWSTVHLNTFNYDARPVGTNGGLQ